ncbi:MAG: hypothetical protein C0490_24760, partial [Marivirga sp.]|nr:hypothetical protein [Marivirga sp.]
MNMAKYLHVVLLLLCFFRTTAQDFKAIDSLLFDAQYDKAIQLIETQIKSKSATDLTILLQNKKAETFIRSGKFKEAEDLLKDLAVKATSTHQKAIVEMNYGSLYLNQGKNDLSLENLQSSIENLQKENKGNTLDAAQALAYLGNLYR